MNTDLTKEQKRRRNRAKRLRKNPAQQINHEGLEEVRKAQRKLFIETRR